MQTALTIPERLSVELTNYCTKGCPFCYNASTKEGATLWQQHELEAFVRDCTKYGTKAVSFGGGEPLEYEGLFDLLTSLRGRLFRSITTNGLLLEERTEKQLAETGIDKVHISIHFPHITKEVTRVRDQVLSLEQRGIRSGVNLLVEKHHKKDAKKATGILNDAGIGFDRIVYLPLKSVSDSEKITTAKDLIDVTDGAPFQSMTCLKACGKSPRFCAVSWDKTAAWCSYTSERRKLKTLDAQGLHKALDGLGLIYCGSNARIKVG